MESVTIRTARHQSGISKVFDLSVVAFFVRFARNENHVVAFHHLLVGVTFLANLGVKEAAKLDPLRLLA